MILDRKETLRRSWKKNIFAFTSLLHKRGNVHKDGTRRSISTSQTGHHQAQSEDLRETTRTMLLKSILVNLFIELWPFVILCGRNCIEISLCKTLTLGLRMKALYVVQESCFFLALILS